MIEPKKLARENLFGLPTYKTGVSRRLLEALASGDGVARLASNENPFGASPRVYEAIRAVTEVHRYPDGANAALRAALGSRLGVDAERIHVSTGSENVLSAVFNCVLSPGDRVVTLSPSFLLAEIVAKAAGAEHVGVGYRDDLSFSASDVAQAVGTGAKILYLANPNNPTGNAFTPGELTTIMDATPAETLVVLDEAYLEYASRHEGLGNGLETLDASGHPYVVLRTFSKAYGLAGLRVGYGIVYDPELIPLVRRASTIFDVGTVAQLAALAALEDQVHLGSVVERTLEEKRRVLSALHDRGARVFPSFGNFVSIWFRTRADAFSAEERLAEQAVFVKALPARRGEGLLRVSIGTPEDNDRFLAAHAAGA